MTTDMPNQQPRKPNLLSVIAHDLKTPLIAAMKYVEMLEMLGPLDEQQRDFVHKTQMALHRMESLVRDILELAELDDALPLRMKYVDLRALVQGELELLESLISAKGIHVHVSIQDGADRVIGDVVRLQQVFNNLLSNAVKYNQPKGDIWISLRRQADMVRVDIRDSGVGIHQDDLPHVFERFYKPRHAQRERDSSGLGLSIARMIVELHGGRIWASSVLNEGATFSFVLPAARRGHDEREPRLQSLEPPDGLDDRLQDSEEQRPLDSHERGG